MSSLCFYSTLLYFGAVVSCHAELEGRNMQYWPHFYIRTVQESVDRDPLLEEDFGRDVELDTSKRTIPRSFIRPGRSGPVEDLSPEEDKDNQSVEQQHNGSEIKKRTLARCLVRVGRSASNSWLFPQLSYTNPDRQLLATKKMVDTRKKSYRNGICLGRRGSKQT